MQTLLECAAGLSFLIWLYLLWFRGGFWRADFVLGDEGDAPTDWPPVVALIPARNEADVIERALMSILAQDYPGPFKVLVIDDHSEDDTAARARKVAADRDPDGRFELVEARPLPAGWAGKLWALSEGRERARAALPEARYIWLSDADIAEPPSTLRKLVAKAERERLDLVSLMVALSCQGFWERLLIPPFILFFQKLYPFAWVADRRKATAAAAGGCVLVSAARLDEVGGFAAIRGELIDDCALAARIKEAAVPAGRGIWLGLGRDSKSLRPYHGLADIWRMVARSAYTQLRCSPLLLAGTLVAMTITYLAPPLALLLGLMFWVPLAALLGAMVWGLMALAAWPSTRFYKLPVGYAALLPLAALFYMMMTFDSARQQWAGRGGHWKGRIEAGRAGVEDGGAGG